MRKLLSITIMLLAVASCSNVKQVGPFEEGKAICRENADTVIAHLNGWRELSSYYSEDRFYTQTDKDGKRTEFYRWVLTINITDGKDTLVVYADDSKGMPDEETWDGDLFGRVISSDTPEAIKRQNLAIKRACNNDTCFTFSVSNEKILSASFTKSKPKEPERPLEDYGLTQQDL